MPIALIGLAVYVPTQPHLVDNFLWRLLDDPEKCLV